jgi:hypothetical protein
LDKELVVFFDEADCLYPHALINFLAQIRDGYQYRDTTGNKFPRSIALVGLRDVKNNLSQIKLDDGPLGFLARLLNAKNEPLALANFTQEEIGILYRQHTAACGQIFDEGAIERAWHWSEGQPWLVNALADQAIVKILKNDFSALVTGDVIDQAAEALIKRRDTHIDYLLGMLQSPRVARVMDGVLASAGNELPLNHDDRQFSLDLGLVAPDERGLFRISNALYAEAIDRFFINEFKHILHSIVPDFPWTNGQDILISNILREFQKLLTSRKLKFPKNNKESVLSQYHNAFYSFSLEAFLKEVFKDGALVRRIAAEGKGAVIFIIVYQGKSYTIQFGGKDMMF